MSAILAGAASRTTGLRQKASKSNGASTAGLDWSFICGSRSVAADSSGRNPAAGIPNNLQADPAERMSISDGERFRDNRLHPAAIRHGAVDTTRASLPAQNRNLLPGIFPPIVR